MTKKLITFLLSNDILKRGLEYCYPIQVRNPNKAQSVLRQSGTSSERLWLDPIVYTPESNATLSSYPNTIKAASSIVCVPGWHINTKEEEVSYKKQIQKILSKL